MGTQRGNASDEGEGPLTTLTKCWGTQRLRWGQRIGRVEGCTDPRDSEKGLDRWIVCTQTHSRVRRRGQNPQDGDRGPERAGEEGWDPKELERQCWDEQWEVWVGRRAGPRVPCQLSDRDSCGRLGNLSPPPPCATFIALAWPHPLPPDLSPRDRRSRVCVLQQNASHPSPGPPFWHPPSQQSSPFWPETPGNLTLQSFLGRGLSLHIHPSCSPPPGSRLPDTGQLKI